MGFYQQRATNLFRYGQCDATTDWTASDGGVTVATDATVVPPFAAQSIKITTNGGTAGQGVVVKSATGQAAAAGTSGVGSMWFRGVAGQSYNFDTIWRQTDSTFAVPVGTSVTATGEWQLVAPTLAATVAVGKVGDWLGCRALVNGTRAESFHVAHAMLESGRATVSLYVMTSGGATKTRPVRLGSGHFYAPHVGR